MKFFTGIDTSQNKVTERTESHYMKEKAGKVSRACKTRKERKIKCRLSEAALNVFNRINETAPHKGVNA